MNIAPYIGNEDFIDVVEDFKIKTKLATKAQCIELESLLRNAMNNAKDTIEHEGKEYPDFTKTEEYSDYIYKTIQYKVADWQGLENNGNVIKCELENDKLKDELMKFFYNVPLFSVKVFEAIQSSKETFNNVSKKK